MILATKLRLPQQWQLATWEDYETLRDDEQSDRYKLFFDN
jgi:hypothetical protein